MFESYPSEHTHNMLLAKILPLSFSVIWRSRKYSVDCLTQHVYGHLTLLTQSGGLYFSEFKGRKDGPIILNYFHSPLQNVYIGTKTFIFHELIMHVVGTVCIWLNLNAFCVFNV